MRRAGRVTFRVSRKFGGGYLGLVFEFAEGRGGDGGRPRCWAAQLGYVYTPTCMYLHMQPMVEGP